MRASVVGPSRSPRSQQDRPASTEARDLVRSRSPNRVAATNSPEGSTNAEMPELVTWTCGTSSSMLRIAGAAVALRRLKDEGGHEAAEQQRRIGRFHFRSKRKVICRTASRVARWRAAMGRFAAL